MSKKKTSKKTSKKKKPAESTVDLRLDGNVYIVETDKNGKEKIEEIDGKVVLQCLIHCITEGLELLEEKMPA